METPHVTKQQLLTLLRAQLDDDDIMLAALRCPDCGKQRCSLDQALALACKADSLQQWFEALDAFEDQLSASPRVLPSAAEVSLSCQALALRARERRFRRS